VARFWKDNLMAEISRLPGPVADVWEWQFQGTCRHVDPAVFFHPEGERGPARRRRDDAAKAVCATCPVVNQCRQHALTVREPYGVWGGMTEQEREAHYAATAKARRSAVSVAG
jgi:WhiB family transcriptional regulator, redox-sensing transcriptional regulator